MSDLSQESPLWREWAESRHSVQRMREELDGLRAKLDTMTAERNGLQIALNDALSELAVAKEDAERYRVIRNWHNNEVDAAVVRAKEPIYGSRLDEIVDAAMGGGDG